MACWSEGTRRRRLHARTGASAFVLAVACVATAHAAGPVGEVTVDCDRVQGWAQDPDTPAGIIDVHLYFDGPAGDPAATGVALTADLQLDAGCSGEQCTHGFRSTLPLSRLDGQPHPVHAYGIDPVDPNLELAASPATYTCPPLPITMGTKRHITNPTVLGQWQFSTYFDLMKVADLDLAAVAEGTPVDAPPQLAIAEGTTQPVWLLDQGFRREVSEGALVAWRFDVATAVPMAAAALEAMPEGTPLSPRPVLAQGTGAAVYLLDDHQCADDSTDPACVDPMGSTTGSAGDDDTGDAGDGGTFGDETFGDDDVDATDDATSGGTIGDDGGTGLPAGGGGRGGGDEGCACSTTPRSMHAAWLVLALFAWRRRSPRG